MIRVPFVDFSRIPKTLKEEWKIATSSVIESGVFIGGEYVSSFEQKWARAIGSSFAIGVGNGLDGLVLALKALQVGPGDFVAVPSHTFIATWNAVQLVGATPIGIDVDRHGLMNLDELENLAQEIKVVIPVHMHGMMVDMDRLQSWAKRKSVRIVEDASQAHFASMSGIFAGNWSDIGVFSLYPSKNLGALGDAGIVTTNSQTYASAIRSYANYGASLNDKYLHQTLGVNSRLDSLQAAVLLINLKYLDQWNAYRCSLADMYIDKLETNTKMGLLNSGEKPSVWHHFPVYVENRAEVRKRLASFGIQTEIHYPHLAAIESQNLNGLAQKQYAIGEKIASKILSLPISPWHSKKQIDFVCKSLNEIARSDFV